MDERDPLVEAEQLCDYRGGTDAWCPVSMDCRTYPGGATGDSDVITHLLTHSKEELAWALLVEEAGSNRLHDLFAYRHDRGPAQTVPYQVTEVSVEATEEIETVLRSVTRTAQRSVPQHLHKPLGIDGQD